MSQPAGAEVPATTTPVGQVVPLPGQAVFDPRAELERARLAYIGGHARAGIRIAEGLVTKLSESSSPRAEDAEVLGSAYTLLGLIHCLRDEAADEWFSQAVQAFAQVSPDQLERVLGVTAADYGVALQHTGAHRQALAELGRALELGQDTPDARRYRAAALRDRDGPGDRDEAHRLLTDAVRRAPRDWQAREWLAALTEELDRDPEEAAGQWAAAWQVLYQDGLFGRALRDGRRAVQGYEQAVRMRPGDVGLLITAGRFLTQVGMDEEAMELLRRAAVLPAKPQARLDIADLLLDLGDDMTAAGLAKGVLTAEPGSERAVVEVARALSMRLDERAFDEAKLTLTRFLRSHPGSAHAEAMLGEVSRLHDRPRDAISHFDRALAAGGEQDDMRAAFLHGGKGQALVQLGQHREGVAELRTAAGRDPRLAWVRFALADAYRDMDDINAAIGELREVIEQNPPAKDRATWVKAMARLGGLLVETGDWAEAVTVLQQIPEPEARNTGVLMPLANALLDGGRENEALKALRHAEQLVPADLDVRTLHARVLYRLGRLDEAADLLTGVLRQDGARWRDRAWLGEVERLRGHLSPALEQLNQVLKDHPDNTWSLSSRAAVYLRLDEPDKAEDDLRRCLDQNPRDLFSLRILRGLLISRRRYGDLVSSFSQAVHAPGAETDAELWREYGQTLRALVPYKEAADSLGAAEKDLAKALDKNPRDLERLRALRDLLVSQGRFTEAVGRFEQAVHTPGAETDAELSREHGETLRQAGRYPEARIALDAALWQSTEKQIPQTCYVLGQLLLDQEKYEEAVDVLDKAVQDPRNPAWYDGCAARILARRYTEARDRLRERLLAYPTDANAWWLLGELYYRVGAWKQAVAAAEGAVRYDPENPQKQELLGWSILRTGEGFSTAEAVFEKAIELEPSRPSGREGKAHVLWLAGRAEAARAAGEELLDGLVREGTEDSSSQATRGWCLARLDRWRDAIIDYLRALPKAGEDRAAIEFDLALCQLQVGQTDDAKATLEQAWLDLPLVSDPNRPQLQPWLRRRGILAMIQQDVQAALAYAPKPPGDSPFDEVQDRLATELQHLPEMDAEPLIQDPKPEAGPESGTVLGA